MNNNVIAPEVAAADFDRFLEEMDLDFELDSMDAEDKTQAEKQKRRIIKAICGGSAVVNDAGEIEYTPQNPKSKYKEAIRFRERTGASLMASDGRKKGHDAAKTYAVMADITGLHSGTFAGLAGIDIKVCEAVFALLMD